MVERDQRQLHQSSGLVGGGVPGSGDDALIDAVGSPYTVEASGQLTVGQVQVGADATLALGRGRFTAMNSAASTANAGVILVGAGATLVGQSIVNTGTIDIAGGHGRHGRAALRFAAPGGCLKGGGEVILEGGRSVLSQVGPNSRDLIINYDNTIMGAGDISGRFPCRIINEHAGVIDANGASPLLVHMYIADYGLVEGTGAGGLSIEAESLYIRPHAMLYAGDGSSVKLAVLEASVGGTFKSAGSGVITASQSGFYSGGYGMTNDADLFLQNCKFGNQAYPFKLFNDDSINLAGTLSVGAITTLEGAGPTFLDGAEIVGLAGASLSLASGAISGSGSIEPPGSGTWGLTIGAAGAIDNPTTGSLVINPGAAIIDNAGTIASAGAGGIAIGGAIANAGHLTASAGVFAVGSATSPASLTNTGVISVTGGTIVVFGTVDGAGSAMIAAGALRFDSGFSEDVKFDGSAGLLGLARSQEYDGQISGFSRHGATTLDLGDIGFVGSGEASFSGTSTSGVLLVTDGAHTARINLIGDFLSTTFVPASDGNGGTDVTARAAAPSPASAQALAAAMAGIGMSPATLVYQSHDPPDAWARIAGPMAAR